MKVRVSYEALPSSSDYENVRGDVERQLPLRNLHWVRKTGANRTIRTIQALPVEFKPLDSFGPNQSALSLLARPYLHVLFVVCDSNETYRATIRAQIREWLDAIIARQHQEWLIVHVTSGKSAGTKFYQLKGAVVDKIKADFNVGKKDRCIQVAQAASAEDPTAWAEFTTKVKEAVVASFDSNVALYEEDVRKADSQRQLEGWQYLPFFLQKEALADSFEAMCLIEDALVQYDELEASFFQALKEHGMSWFGKFGGTAIGDDALPLLSTTNKPYRRLIQANDISVFDFRIYLFARQATMLFQLGRIAEVSRRGAFFISTFARTLRQHQASLGDNFVESWTYSACLNIVDECQRAVDRSAVDRSSAASFLAAKAELLELARKQLDKLGMGAGHLPFDHPFAMSLHEVASVPSPNPSTEIATRPPVSRKDLLDALSTRDVFDKLYIDVTNRTIQAYSSSGRKRCSLKLHSSLAALENHRGRQDSAQKLYSHLPAHYVDLRWVKIEASLLKQCTDLLQDRLKMPRERLLSTLALIRAGVELGSKEWDLDAVHEASMRFTRTEDMEKLATQLMKDVYDLSSTLSKDFAAIAFPTFSMTLASDIGVIAAREDGVSVALTIKSLLPCSLRVDEVRLKFATSEGDQVWFTASSCELKSGETRIDLFCPAAVTGRLALELSQIRFSRIIFQYSHRPVSSRNLAPGPRNTPLSSKQPCVRFPHDFQALDVYTEAPDTIDLDEERRVIICVSAGRNDVTKAHVKIATSPMSSLNLSASTVVNNGGDTRIAAMRDDCISLENLAAHSEVQLAVPVSADVREPSLELTMSVEYYTSKRPSTKRTARRVESYALALPLAVNVQDFFRQDCVLSKFSVTTDGLRGLKVQSALLSSAGTTVVKSCRARDSPPLTILPLQTANFLFKLSEPVSAEKRKTSRPDLLRFELRYCAVDDQVIARIRVAVEDAVGRHGFQHDARWFLQILTLEVQAHTDLLDFITTGRFSKAEFDPERWVDEVKLRFEERHEAAMSAIRDFYNALHEGSNEVPTRAWRTLIIPVEMPSLDILNLVQVTSDADRIEVGQPVTAAISIRSTFSWSHSSSPTTLALVYDVTFKTEDWLVSGRKRGQFTAEDGQAYTVNIVLVPLRPGALFLPSAAIRPLSPSHATLTCETQHLNAAATLEVLPGASASRSLYVLEQDVVLSA